MKFTHPRIERGTIVCAWRADLKNITPKKSYKVVMKDHEWIYFKDDSGELGKYRSIFFMESDVVFAIGLYMTLTRLRLT